MKEEYKDLMHLKKEDFVSEDDWFNFHSDVINFGNSFAEKLDNGKYKHIPSEQKSIGGIQLQKKEKD
jgi:hypothetical protein